MRWYKLFLILFILTPLAHAKTTTIDPIFILPDDIKIDPIDYIDTHYFASQVSYDLVDLPIFIDAGSKEDDFYITKARPQVFDINVKAEINSTRSVYRTYPFSANFPMMLYQKVRPFIILGPSFITDGEKDTAVPTYAGLHYGIGALWYLSDDNAVSVKFAYEVEKSTLDEEEIDEEAFHVDMNYLYLQFKFDY